MRNRVSGNQARRDQTGMITDGNAGMKDEGRRLKDAGMKDEGRKMKDAGMKDEGRKMKDIERL